MIAEVSVRIGSFGTSSRTHVSVPEPRFQLSSDATFEALVAVVNERVEVALRGYEHPTHRDDLAVYFRPSPTTPQRDLVPLTAANYRACVSASRALFEKRHHAVGELICELFVFAVKRATAPASHRATQSRIADATSAIGNYLLERPELHVGEIARTHWAVSHARRSTGATVEMPTSATFRQAQNVDEIRESIPTATDEPDFGTVRARLMESRDLTIELNIVNLRRILGLPAHNLLAEGIFRSIVPPQMPEKDMPDLDHQESDDDNQ